MKFTVSMKDPDGPWEDIREAALKAAATVTGISEEERAELVKSREEALMAWVKKWLRYGEYADIEFDTEADTATLLKDKP